MNNRLGCFGEAARAVAAPPRKLRRERRAAGWQKLVIGPQAELLRPGSGGGYANRWPFARRGPRRGLGAHRTRGRRSGGQWAVRLARSRKEQRWRACRTG